MIRVVTAGQASAADAAAIASGTASFNLMASAGTHAAALIEARWRDRLRGVLVVAGSGNNGGDGYVVADALRRSGAGVHLLAFGAPRTADAQRAASEAHAVSRERPAGAGEPTLVVDAVLGTGSSGPPRGDAMAGIAEVRQWRARGVPVIALDLPSGLDATTGEADGVVPADWTITFGHVKRGLLIARGTCGRITAVDIGLGRHGEDIAGSLELVDEAWVAARIPPIAAEAYKGSRRRVAIVGGDVGMAGAPILAARGAMRSGVGMVRLLVEARSLPVVQVGAPEATAVSWPLDDAAFAQSVSSYAQALLIGPGLGRGGESRRLLDQVWAAWSGPVVLDADALTLYAQRVDELRDRLRGRAAIVTPHAGECAALMATTTEDVLRRRFEIPFELAARTGAVVLLKGVPTIIAAPDGRGVVSASGTPVLAAAGSGDVLGGIAVTLLAQRGDPFDSAACAAWTHGRAAEIAGAGRPIRGVVLDDVCHALANAWRIDGSRPDWPVLAELPPVGDPPPRDT